MMSRCLRLPFALPPLILHRPLDLPMLVLHRPFLNFPGSFLGLPCQLLPVIGVVGLPVSSVPQCSGARAWYRGNRMWTWRAPPATTTTTVHSMMEWTSETPASSSTASTHPTTAAPGTLFETVVGLSMRYGHLAGL